MPVSFGSLERSSVNASRPPADAPIPTTRFTMFRLEASSESSTGSNTLSLRRSADVKTQEDVMIASSEGPFNELVGVSLMTFPRDRVRRHNGRGGKGKCRSIPPARPPSGQDLPHHPGGLHAAEALVKALEAVGEAL